MSGITEYLYDENGSLVSEKEGSKTARYQYDLLNRQIYVRTLAGREQENLYDGEGLRAGLKENGKVSTFLFYNGEILGESDGDNIPVRRYIQGAGLSHMQTVNDGSYHAYHQDEQGSTAYITGSRMAVENCYVYDAFGNVLEKKEDTRSCILYTGQQYDQETGQYYLRARYYNPVVGRFMQEDTYRGDGLNLYAYCANNPVMYYDPSGHNCDDNTSNNLEDTNNLQEIDNTSSKESRRTPAQEYADELRELPKKERPNTVAVLETVDGQQYRGYNGEGVYSQTVQERLDDLGNINHYNRQCAEVNALSKAVEDGADLNGSRISTANVRGINGDNTVHGSPKMPCDVCGPMLESFGVEYYE